MATATGSPSKFSVPNRKMRNQPTNRIHDIEFAAEISTSLITQVRNLQSLLQERDEELKDIKSEKSGLEVEVQAFQQRMKNLDDSESRYKDENWNLETQIQELIAGQKEAADREKRLAHSLGAIQADKNATQRELDEIRQAHSKLAEDHAAAVKHHDIELGTARRNAVMAEGERAALQRKIDELTSQNQELAKAMAVERGRQSQRNSPAGSSEDDLENAGGNMTPEHSPPPSPIKPTPRHSMLETETLKTSLQHAQRTIQSLRTNVHREKTEKLELKRLLQDARDEIEKLRSDPVERPHQRRAREAKSREFKKPVKLDKLGTARAVKAEILEDPEWEEVNTARGSPPMLARMVGMVDLPLPSTENDDFETANEAHETTDAFETAHERGTETEDFQTGAENFTDSDTETDSPSKRVGALRAQALKKAPVFASSSRDYSYESTASTSNSEDEDFMDPTRTPTSPLMRVRNRVSRSTMSRRSRQLSEEPAFQRSPGSQPNSSFSSAHNAPQQSLFAELGELEGSDEDSATGTPGVRSLRSVTPASITRGATRSPRPVVPALPSVLSAMMVDSGTMTDPVDLEAAPTATASERPIPIDSVLSATQDRPVSMSAYSDAGAQYDSGMGEKSAKFPTPTAIGSVPTPFLPPPQSLSMSNVYSQELEPRSEPEPEPIVTPRLGLSGVLSEDIEPAVEPEAALPALSLSQVVAEGIEPVTEPESPLPAPPVLSVSSIVAEDVMPIKAPEALPPTLAFSALSSSEVEPVAEPEPEPRIVHVVEYVEAPQPPPADLMLSAIYSAEVEPIAEPERQPEILRVIEYVEAPEPPPADLALSAIVFAEVEPVPEVEREPEVVRVVEYVEAPKPPTADLALSAIASADVEPIAEPEKEPQILRVVEYVEAPKPLPPALSFSGFVSEDTEPREEPTPLPPTLSVSSIAMEGVEPISEPEAPQPFLSISPISVEHLEPVAEPATLPPALSVSTILSEQIAPLSPPEEKPVLRSLDFSSIQSLETTPMEPESPIFGKVLPPLQLSAIEALDTAPTSPRSLKRDAIGITRDEERPVTPASKGFFGSFWSRGNKQADTVVIAEDDTRQSANASPSAETPESQRPFKEISANTNEKTARRAPVETSDSSAQTALTADAIDQMFNAKNTPAVDYTSESLASPNSTPGTVRVRRGSQESLHSIQRSKGKAIDVGVDAATEAALRRPGSAASTRASVKDVPPLPSNHKEVIEAARTGTANSGQGTIGSMGPPLFPASAYKNPINRPRTATSAVSVNINTNTKLEPVPRPERLGTADIHSPTRLLTARSRKSSVSSFASEVDHRFNMHNGMAMDAHGFGPNTDPRMIQAITQTMIGEYLWKYTRKTGRGELSENRHRRYFWVHPYTRTLYWSDRDPTSGGRAELRAKSVPIEAVRVVTDDNPMPPGLHRKSLIIISPGRSIKFTCTTGQRHETWFNALSYLLLRTNSEGQADTEEMMNGITREDVDEFNPPFARRNTGNTLGTPRGAPSISSYNSRGTRNEAGSVNLDVPTLTPNHKKAISTSSVTRPSLAGRLSGYWRSTQDSLSLRSRSGVRDQYSLYSNNDVHDSAEDLREEYERQDRESDRLDNVRACCEGKLETFQRDAITC